MKGLTTLIVFIGIIAGGYYYYAHNKSTVDGAISSATSATNGAIATTTTSIDSAIQAGLKSVNPISLYYYTTNRNYGISDTKNICNDTTSSNSIGAIISDIQIYTKSISCVVDPNFPSKSFTIVASSVANSGQYYCTDQNGAVNLIPSVSQTSTFKSGISCK